MNIWKYHDWIRRGLAFLLTLAILAGMLPQGTMHVHAADTVELTSLDDFAGKKVSILSHSMSTYDGVSNNSSNNTTIGNNDVYYTEGRHDVFRKDTWWQQAIDALGMELLVNNSWSGSCIFMPRKGAASVGYGDRAVNLHNDITGEEPDIIWVYLGCNDFAYYQDTFGKAGDIDYASLIRDEGDGSISYAAPTTACEAYAIMLHKVENRYPNAQIYCMTSTARRDPDYPDSYADTGQPTAYSAELHKVAAYFGFPVIDLESCIPKEAEIFDQYIADKRAHANALGMDKITNAVLSVMLGKSVEIRHVTSGNGVVTERAVLLGGSYHTEVDIQEGYSLSVVMDGKDITEEAYSNGTISIGKVTGDIEVSTKRGPENFRWELQDGLLVSTGEAENTIVRLEGTTENGIFIDTRYQLTQPFVLLHDQEWILEWKMTGPWVDADSTAGKKLFSEDGAQSTVGAIAIGTKSNAEWLAINYYNGTSHVHYGIDLAEYGLSLSESHAYRLYNEIAEDGSNMIWLAVDGVVLGAMDTHLNTGNKSDWVSGQDFTFGYLGTPKYFLDNGVIDYISVWEGGETSEPMSLRYDDHYDLTGKTVEIVDAGKPTSYKVGYGVALGTLDDAVVTLEDNTLVATGIGTAKVRIDGTLYEVTVTAAPISLLLLAGQSNMQGSEGDANQSIVCPDGMVYSTYGDRYTMTVDNATNFAPSALTGAGSAVNVNGTTTNLKDWPVYLLNEAGAGKAGPDSGFAYEWVRQTGEKVWVVNAAHGGTNISLWQPGTKEYEECQALFTACTETLRKEIAAGHFTLSHMGYFWCQGCANYSNTAEWYVQKYLTMHDGFKSELAFDHDSNPATPDKTFEFGGIIPVRAGHESYTSYRQGVYTDTTTAKYHESFKDLRFTGPRVAQYWMTNNPELPDIWNVCNIGEDWVWMPNGTNGVTEYFQAHYPGGTVDYTTQVQQSASWYTPTTPKAVHDSIHYNQIGYNEVGREAARNALIMLGEIEAPEVETKVELLTWDGYTLADEVKASTSGSSGTLVVPKVYPVWKSKEVTYQLSDGLTWSYYDLLAADTQMSGTLTAVGAEDSVSVVKAEPYSHFLDHLAELPEEVCCGLNLWNVLEHDKEYYANGTGWGIYSSGNVPSVTIFLNPGDKLYATSFGKAGTNGHSSTNGIRMTYFSEYGVVKTLAPADVYKEFTANGGYLIAPEGTVAVNIPMWTNSDQWEIYILNREHDQSSDICSICGKDSHTHSFSDWETVTAPSIDGPGEETRSCACGETESREVKGVWQTCDLTEHMSPMPDAYCAGTNLWAEMEHDKYFYSGGTNWGIHSSGNVYSVTIPVSAGDKIFATAFGKGGTNGGTSNGIRVTFFDAYGVVKTLAPADTYAEFTANGGYLVAPEGTVAVNIPMWTNSDSNELYILNREHDYKGTTCTICGAEHPEAGDYAGKVISILGDSISTFAGYIPVADGFNLDHRTRYPQDNLLTDVNETWWMQIIRNLDAKLGINDSWASTEVYNYIDAEVNSTSDGTKACMASITRIQNLGSNGTPDVILFFGGTNDITQSRPLGTFDPATAPTEVDLTSVKWNTVANAYVDAIMRMQYYYPDAQIVAMLPYYRNSQGNEKVNQYNSLFTAICEHYGVPYVDLRYCGISNTNLPDGTHPDADGMDYITAAVLDALISDCNLVAGEHIVHTVTHNLTDAKSSLGYYKGVSHGKTFMTTISGKNLKVTVAMGGVDITASAYADGVVNIPNVTGDIVIRAVGEQKSIYADYLQQLPETVCAGINLWTALAPINLYYRSTGWGINATGLAHSVTIPITPGDQLWSTSFQISGINGGTRNGIALTWFDEDSAIVTMSPDEVYAEFSANGYLTAPEGAVAVNVVMWNGDNSNELYILNREHDYKSSVTAPTCTEQGYTTYTCTLCGDSYVDSYVDATGEHSYDDGVCVWCGVSILGSDWLVPDFAEGDYTMVVLPDTQILVQYWPEIYYNQMQWIADNKDNLNIQGVLHMGDMVNNNNDTEWTVCEAGTDMIDAAGIPWMPMRGNHDDSAWFNRYYDYETYGTNQSWFGGSYEAGKLDHTYWYITVGEREYLILSLGWAPSWDVLNWAQGIVEENSDKSVILACHAYMNKDGSLLAKGDSLSASTYIPGYPSGEDVWNAFKSYGNVVLAMGGHVHSADLVTWVGQNGAGQDVTSLLVDRQDDDTKNRYAMIALLTFHADSETVDVNWYSTRYDALFRAKNQFSITVPGVCEHNYTSAIVKPTCTEDGGTKYTCSICNHSYWENPESALGHSYENNVCATCGIIRVDMTEQFTKWTTGGPVLFRNGYGYGEEGFPDGSNPNLKYSDYISVEGIDTLELTVCARKGHSATGGYAFYTDKGVEYFISEGASTRNGNGAAAEGTVIHTIAVPEEAKYIRVSYWVDSTSYALAVPFSCVGYTDHVHTYTPNVTAPTCTEKGYTTHTCTGCGDSYVSDYVPAKGHTEVIDKAVAATCTTAGKTEGKHCSVCNTVIVAQQTVPTKGHTEVIDKAVAATCTKTGLTEGKHCSVCNTVIVAQQTVPAKGHTEVVDKAISATCTTAGKTEGKHCSVCNAVIVAQTEVPAKGHTWDNGKVTKEPTEKTEGVRTYTCTACKQTRTETIPVLDHIHNYSKKVTAPTCTEQGYTTYTCACGYSYVSDYVPAKGHTEVIDKAVAATCTTAGKTEGKHCSVCNTVIVAQQTVPAKGHTEVIDKAVAATCTTAGKTEGKHCSVCNTVIVAQQTVPAKGHTEVVDKAVAATCTTAGKTEGKHCSVCDTVIVAQQTVPAKGHTEVIDKAVAATCTKTGLTEGKHCSACNTVLVAQQTVPAKGHTWDNGKVTKEPTENASGVKTYTCKTCGEIRTETIPALGHTHSYTKKVTAPTCTAEGYTTYTCKCGDTYTADRVKALGHDYKSAVTKPTCTEPGYTTYTCSRCKDTYTGNRTAALGHDYKSVVTAPTCEAEGYTTNTCSRCKDTYTSGKTPAAGHKWDSGKVTKQPTETASGVRTYTCSVCGKTKTEVIPPLEHTHKYSEKVTAPTCTEQGYTTYTCACGESYTDDFVNALDHSYGKWTVSKEATCEVNGEESRSCTRCNASEKRSTEALGHNYKAVITKPTCEKEGYTTHTCSRCADSYTDSKTAALGHSWDNGIVTKEPTEESTGLRLFTCTVCGETKTEVIAELSHTHSYTKSVTAPTCLEKGYTTYTCKCGHSYTSDDKAALGHSYGSWTASKAATCTAKGEEHRSCTRCDHYETRPTNALGHSYESITVKPTCGQGGYTIHDCTRCDSSYTDAETPATGHSWDSGKVTREPTENTSGEKTYTCTLCGKTRTEVIPAQGHTHVYTSVVTLPTCTEQGYTTHVCLCGDSYTDSYIAAQGHSMGGWTQIEAATCTDTGTDRRECIRCGHAEARQTPATGHNHQGTVTPPTCTEQGYTTYTCVCGDSYVSDHMDALGHSWGQWVETVAPTMHEDGVNTRVCTACSATQREAVDNNPFTDVTRDDQFEPAILWAYYNSITKGTSATQFSGEQACTRKQIVTFLWRAAGEPEPESMENPFTDVKHDQFEKAILWAYCEGITKGTSATEFSPENPCTRKQIVTFLWRYHGSPEPDSMEDPFTDVMHDQFEKAILWAYYAGVTMGTSVTEFSPENPCTRKQIVTFLWRDLTR